MKIQALHIFTRYRYDEKLVSVHGTPLWDNKHECAVKPTTTVRMGGKFLTPKQIVYILHHPDAYPLPDNLNPTFELPAYIINKDDNPNNICIGNLQARTASRRWSEHNKSKHVVSDYGVWFPKDMLALMTYEDMVRHDVSPDHPSPQ